MIKQFTANSFSYTHHESQNSLEEAPKIVTLDNCLSSGNDQKFENAPIDQ